MDEKLPINKGVELMLRRGNKEPKTKGLKIDKLLSLFRKEFNFKFEFTWRDLP
jgi:hypothetical protein